MNSKINQKPKRRTAGSLPESRWKFPLDKARKNAGLALIQKEVQLTCIRRHPSFAENVRNQLRFQTWQQWMMQGSVLLAAMLLVLFADSRKTGGFPDIAAVSVFLVFAGNICFSGVGYLFSYHMAELEKTLYLDLKQMVCIQMLEGGIIDLAVLILFTAFLGRGCETGITAYFLYLLVPFLWSDILYLAMLTHLRSVFTGLKQFASGMLCAALSLLPAFSQDAYEEKYIAAWALLSVAGFLFLAAEIYQMFQKIERGENICLN